MPAPPATFFRCGTGSIVATGLPAKSRGVYVVQFLCASIDDWGYVEVTIRSDQEPAIHNILEAVKRTRGARTLLEKSPRYSHASLGHAEQGNQAVEKQVLLAEE